MLRMMLLFLMLLLAFARSEADQVFIASKKELNTLLPSLARYQNNNDKVAMLANDFRGRPYLYANATGEGSVPLYRLDGFNCQTFVEVVLASLHAKNIHQFDNHFLQIAYGANHNQPTVVSFINRNHIIETDFNPVNERNGYLLDVLHHLPYLSFDITRNRWLIWQDPQLNVDPTIKQRVRISYIPKNKLLLLASQLPTPAVVEVVHNPFPWQGSLLSISHMGILFRNNGVLEFTDATDKYPRGSSYNGVEIEPFFAFVSFLRQNESVVGVHVEKMM